jgi:hypothetical protein
MGGHYGTIHVRTRNSHEVRSALERLSGQRTRRFLLAPAIDGWVTVYPELNGQDPAVSEALATILGDRTLIHCLVHDDDLFAYWLYENGSIVDTYNSQPDYFGETNPPPRGGNAQAFAHLLIDPSKVNKLQVLLDVGSFDFELQRQDQFAALLGLPNTAYAYEYLQSGEIDGVRQWKEFIHIPDLAPEKAARKAAAQQHRNELKRLHSDRVLLVNEKAAKSSNKHFFKNPLWAIDPISSSVVLTWPDPFYGSVTETLWQRFSRPDWASAIWSAPPLERLRALQFSSAGSWFATISRGGLQLDIWDRRDMRRANQRTFASGVTTMAFSADERWIFVVITNQGRRSELHRVAVQPGGQDAVLAHELAHFQMIVSRPDGRFLAVVDNFGVLVIVDVERMSIVNQVWIKETHSSLPEGVRDSILAHAGETFEAGLKNHLSAEELTEHRKQSARHFLPKEALRLCCFSPDGQWLFCGTREGVRGLHWNDVLQCGDMQPVRVRLAVDAESVSHDVPGGGVTKHNFVYGVVFDALRQRVLFSGLEGKISFLELNDGRTGDLLAVPGREPLIQLGLTPDRTAIVATAHRMAFGSSKQLAPHFQIWNYRALCEAAKLDY